MDTRRIIKSLLVFFVILFIILSVYLMYIINAYGTRWFANPHNTRVQNRRSDIAAGDVLDRNGTVLVTSDSDGNRVYLKDKNKRLSMALLIGDEYGQALGAETFFSSYLLGFDQGAFDIISSSIYGQSRRGSNIRLTVDASLCEYAYDLLDGKSGAVVLINYKTGEILAETSSPAYDPNKVQAYLSGEEEPRESSMVNRVTLGQYAPGSVFKIVTTLAALRNIEGVDEMTFDCTGGLVFDYETGRYLGNSHEVDVDRLTEKYSVLHDYQSGQHGALTLEDAFAKSCNETFAAIAMRVGAKNMYRTASSLGLGGNFLFSDMTASSGNYATPSRDVDLAWSGVGQYNDIMSPINMCMITAGIANDGDMMEPRLLRMASTSRGNVTYTFTPSVYKSIMKADEAATLKKYMKAVVERGTGTAAKLSGLEVGGKTGTAEVTVNGENLSHAWFTGFIDSEDHPLAVCVTVEFGGSGGLVAAPIAHDLLARAVKLGY